MALKKSPIGIEDFETMCRNDYYYVDKTGMIAELLGNLGTVNLFTRPRRFGKSLTMSMLKYFFEVGTDKSLFDGLAISREQELCEMHMGKYPVISLSLKGVQGFNFEDAKSAFADMIGMEARRFTYLQDSEKLQDEEKQVYRSLRAGQSDRLENSLLRLSELLYTHHGEKVIILIDEYDVPLQKAEEEHYYRPMVSLMSRFFGNSMKTNPYMAFAVVTGCLRISKESIFTGFNNPKMHTIIDKEYDEWFGFTDEEVRKILEYYGKREYYALTREWYDGYLFGDKHIYCPWDVISWMNQMSRNDDYIPRNYWANTSGNSLIRRFADMADDETREEMEILLAGGTITKELDMEITYDELDSNIEHIWSVLFMTGYLTFAGRDEEGAFILRIPNKEITNLFRKIFENWFKDKIRNDKEGLKAFWNALEAEDAVKMTKCINYALEESISYMDGGKLSEKESFYHGLMVGMLKSRSDWAVKSNREAGQGRLDVAVYKRRGEEAMIFEFKYVQEEKQLEKAAYAALGQISENDYDRFFTSRTPEQVTHYGIAFCKKRCLVVKD